MAGREWPHCVGFSQDRKSLACIYCSHKNAEYPSAAKQQAVSHQEAEWLDACFKRKGQPQPTIRLDCWIEAQLSGFEDVQSRLGGIA